MAYGLQLMYWNLHERVMHSFGYLKGIPRVPTISAPPPLLRKDEKIFVEYHDLLIPEDVRSVPVLQQ